MRHLQLLFLFTLLVGCQNHNDEIYANVLKKNNERLINEIETLKLMFHQKAQDQPSMYSEFSSELNDLTKSAFVANNASDYKKVMGKIVKMASAHKLKFKADYIKSEIKDILRNNLYTNIVSICNSSPQVVYCGYHTYGVNGPFLVTKRTKDDSVFVKVGIWNKYNIITDSIIDSKGQKIPFNSLEINTLSDIRFHTNSDKSTYYGKVFYKNDAGNTVFLQKLVDTIRK